jgi:hypothetical protein
VAKPISWGLFNYFFWCIMFFETLIFKWLDSFVKKI